MAFKFLSAASSAKEFTEIEILTDLRSANKKVAEMLREASDERKPELLHYLADGKPRLIAYAPEGKTENLRLERLRILGEQSLGVIKLWKTKGIRIGGKADDKHKLALAEGIALASYSFDRYKSRKKKKEPVQIYVESVAKKEVEKLNVLLKGVMNARDLVNDIPAEMTAVRMAETFQKMGKEAGFKTEILQKKKIQALKMGGLLAVNQGSSEPPTFTIMEYKPSNAVNKKPYVLVGKGVSFDSGGLNIKTSTMELMKSDMAGSAAVAGALYAVAANGLPVHVIGLVPATDNRVGPDSFSPGDVITTCDGTTVEVLNTDAEGRLILADALCYALRYKPELIIDLATLTGAAMRAIGTPGIVAMGNIKEAHRNLLFSAGEDVHERLVEFPLWDEYGEMIRSQVADIANLGGPLAGAITAGKFLEHFTRGWNWMHLDIAAPSYLEKKESYRGMGGTGTGVRLLFRFFEKIAAQK